MSVLLGANDIKRTVVYIFSGTPTGHDETLISNIRPLGTGFFISVPNLQVEGRAWPYFVTAKHVLKRNEEKYRSEIYVRANLRDWASSSDQNGADFYRVPVLDDENRLLWSIHSDSAVDLAILQNFPNPDVFEYKIIPVENFATTEVLQREGVAEGDEVFFPCFTPEIRQQRRNYPLVRFGRIALVSGENMPTPEGDTRFHIAECFPFGGNSGSPVFLRFGPTRRADQIVVGQERYLLLGVMHGYFLEQQPVDVQRVDFRLFSRQNMGIGLITPVDYLRDILYSESLRRVRGEVE